MGALPGGPNFDVDMHLDARVLLFTLGLSVVTGLLFGVVPAIQSSRPGLVSALKDQSDLSLSPGSKLTARNALVVAQLALCLVALVAAGLCVRSLQAARQLDLGYETDDLLVLGFNVGLQGFSEEQGRQFFRQVRERVESVPGVTDVALAQGGPLQGTLLRSVLLEGESPEERTFVQVNGVSSGYFEAMGIAIEEGRGFLDSDRTGTLPVVVVNREMAEKYWPGRSALGQRLPLLRHGAGRGRRYRPRW